MGLLGLNGAGKSSTLRMLAGVLAPDSGDIRVAGHSLLKEPVAAKSQIGYLPEVAPLYPDMRVADYIDFAARLHRVKQPRQRVNSILEELDLGSVAKRRIANLSKGYRQRVGIAQALVHKPGLVILDEPSSGLDPEQMRDMRELVKQLGSDCGVIFSSHLLSEVNDVCTDVVVLHHAQVVHKGSLGAEVTDQNYNVRFSRTVKPEELLALPAVKSVSSTASGSFCIQPKRLEHNAIGAEQLLQALVHSGYPVIEFAADKSSLEHLFSTLVQTDGNPSSVAA